MTDSQAQNHNPTKTEKVCNAGWTVVDRKKIASIVYPLIEIQKAYGRILNAELVMKGWEAILAPKYSGDQIVYALTKYALERGDDFPSPKNLHEILNPPKPRITEAQFVEAQKWQERNGYPMFSDAKETIDDYKEQEKEKQQVWKFENQELLALSGNAIQRIPSFLGNTEQKMIEE